MDDRKILLSEKEMPVAWYNVLPDLPEQLPPPLDPATGKPVEPSVLAKIFPMSLLQQEMSTEPWIEIPEEIRKVYAMWRPTPLHRAVALEKYLKTPARIYFKNESVSPPGSHKPNTAVAQAYYNKKEGVKRLCTETGAGQWGSALAFACNLFDLECVVYMVKISYQQKPYRRIMMQTWNAKIYPSPSDKTNYGRKLLKENPENPGSLGIAISEAIEDTISSKDSKYSLGSVLNHVLLHQTIVGLETQKQLALVGEKPDVLVGCVGGGSNFAGLVLPFVKDKIKGKSNVDVIGVEPTACPTMTKGPYRYDYGDTSGLTPLLKMLTLGHDFMPPGIHAGGLRYHGLAPIVSMLVNKKIVRAEAVAQTKAFEAAVIFARTEGFIPAPETSHAIRVVIDEARKCAETGEEKCIVFNFSGHGHFDLSAYDAYLTGKLQDYEYPEEKIRESLEKLPKIE
ncbi:MAG TPA: TrpB-like pyridoxal phosphate-dependent enzyme [bacterium]|nr:TrpB-like pyridoxal phosphate-dependent enzyme [bacterium]HOL34482.1 TrpB-like pyridoxal phosphate-dependent enzyme [bacterium]HPP08460.1 TrpB-like pyridoxal phosphate-dependent enzyme [bacterium]